jgi:hypothetical protein
VSWLEEGDLDEVEELRTLLMVVVLLCGTAMSEAWVGFQVVPVRWTC